MSLEWPEDTQPDSPPPRRVITDPLYISRELAGDYDREARHARTYQLKTGAIGTEVGERQRENAALHSRTNFGSRQRATRLAAGSRGSPAEVS